MPRKTQPTVGTATTGTVNADARIDEAADLAPQPEPTPEPEADAPAAEDEQPAANDPTPPAEAMEPAPPAIAAAPVDPHLVAVEMRVANLASADRAAYPNEQAGTVIFVSSAVEPEAFPVRIGTEDHDEIRGRWDGAMEHVIWRVPEHLAARFERHFFCKTGRILRAG